MTNQVTVRSTGTSISTNTSTNTCICTQENASIVRTLFDLFKERREIISEFDIANGNDFLKVVLH